MTEVTVERVAAVRNGQPAAGYRLALPSGYAIYVYEPIDESEQTRVVDVLRVRALDATITTADRAALLTTISELA